jgi:DNA-binding CsgD family transcriptional regulator
VLVEEFAMSVLRSNITEITGEHDKDPSAIRSLSIPNRIVLVIDPTSKTDLDVLSDEYKLKLESLALNRNHLEEIGEYELLGKGAVAPLRASISTRPEAIRDALTGRQRDVLRLIVRGMSNKEIARSLNLAEGTVKIHVAALFAKLRVNRRAAVAIAGSRFLADMH